jgi:carbamoyltransferase
MFILGISAYYHDSAACIIYNDEIIAAAQEERFTRIKHDESFPANAVKYCLKEAGISIDDLEAVVYYEKPFLKFERLIESFYHFAPKGVVPFVKSIPVWVKEKLFIKDQIIKSLKEIDKFDRKNLNIRFSEHHLSHAASAFYPSGFESAAVLTIDGMGEWASASISKADKNGIEIIKELHYPNSLGLLYTAFTYFLGFKVNSGEYKLMGLAPYGSHDSEQIEKFIKIIKAHLVDISKDGSIKLDMKYFAFATSLKMIKTAKWEKLFDIKRLNPSDKITQKYSDLALAIQKITEEIVIKMAIEAKRITNKDNLCLAGGVSLNCVANGALLREKTFDKIYIQPASGDAGGAIGAALAYAHIGKGIPYSPSENDKMKGAYLGPSFSNKEVLKTARKYNSVFHHYENKNNLFEFTANEISKNKIIGWFRGRMEFGPRALGNRSILADARNPETQKKLNLKIKYREGFRPFAPSVLEEDISHYFDIEVNSPYMLLVADVKESIRKKLPKNYESFDMMDKLYTLRSDVPAITHCDFSARVQSVSKKTNPDYHQLISKFKEKTGTGLIVNTSFNVRGEPIVCNPDEAFRCFMRTEMDILIMEDYAFIKDEQTIDKKLFNQKFKPD